MKKAQFGIKFSETLWILKINPTFEKKFSLFWKDNLWDFVKGIGK